VIRGVAGKDFKAGAFETWGTVTSMARAAARGGGGEIDVYIGGMAVGVGRETSVGLKEDKAGGANAAGEGGENAKNGIEQITDMVVEGMLELGGERAGEKMISKEVEITGAERAFGGRERENRKTELAAKKEAVGVRREAVSSETARVVGQFRNTPYLVSGVTFEFEIIWCVGPSL
jgi:hypothetical protein